MLHKAWAGLAYEYKYVHAEERVALSSFSTFSLSMAESSVGWQLSLSASDIIIPGRMWGLNQRAACTTCTVRGALYEIDLHETPGDSHYSPAAYQALNPRNTPRGENGPRSRLRWGCRLQEGATLADRNDWWFLDGCYYQMLNFEKKQGVHLVHGKNSAHLRVISVYNWVLNLVFEKRNLSPTGARQIIIYTCWQQSDTKLHQLKDKEMCPLWCII